MTIENFNVIKNYLIKKKVPFAIRIETNKIVGISITKEGKFYRANGIIVAGNIAKCFI